MAQRADFDNIDLYLIASPATLITEQSVSRRLCNCRVRSLPSAAQLSGCAKLTG